MRRLSSNSDVMAIIIMDDIDAPCPAEAWTEEKRAAFLDALRSLPDLSKPNPVIRADEPET